jgi:hypothetical protein
VALAAELGKLNEEYGETQNGFDGVVRAMESMKADGSAETDVRQALQKLDPLWDELFPAEKERIVKLLVQEVVVSPDGLLIRLRLNGLNSLVGELQGHSDDAVQPPQDGQTIDLRVPTKFKVRGGRKEVILPPEANGTPDVGPHSPLVVALARAHRWQRMIDSGDVTGAEAIPEQHGLDRTYVSRILGLAVLAPDVVEAIVKGNEPSGLSLGKLHRNLPLRWDEQRRLLKCPGTKTLRNLSLG